MIALYGCFLDGTVHALDLPIRLWMVDFRQAMFDAMFPADTVEDMCKGMLILFAVGELDAAIGKDRMYFVRHGSDDVA